MNHEDTERAVARDETRDPFADIGQVGRPKPPLPPAIRPPDPPRTIGKAGDTPPNHIGEQPLEERAAHVVDAASMAIVENINTLITRAERLKASLMDDTAEVKGRIKANLNHGARILELSKKLNTELDEIENLHRKQTKG